MMKTDEEVLAVVKTWLQKAREYDGPMGLHIDMVAAISPDQALYNITAVQHLGGAALPRQLTSTFKPVTITVNGTKVTWSKPTMSYEELLELVHGHVGWSATYDRGVNDSHGTLYVGKVVDVVHGMDFDCCHTGNA